VATLLHCALSKKHHMQHKMCCRTPQQNRIKSILWHVCATNFSLNCMRSFHGYTVQYFMRMHWQFWVNIFVPNTEETG